MNDLALRIFRGEYGPGQRLPPTRELAEQLGTDRTSLRIALERLKQVGVVTAVQGSGVTVNNLHREASVGFLSELFRGPSDGSHESVLLQMLEFGSALAPGLIALTARRTNPELLRQLDLALAHQEEVADDLEALADAAVETEDLFARSVGNLVVSLIYNATRPLRRELLRRVFSVVDARNHVAQHRAWMRELMLGEQDGDVIIAKYQAWQDDFHCQARAAIVGRANAAAPADPPPSHPNP